MSTIAISAYKKSDLLAAEKMLRLRLAQFKKHIDSEQWGPACNDLRAIESEAKHAGRAAAALSLDAHLQLYKAGR